MSGVRARSLAHVPAPSSSPGDARHGCARLQRLPVDKVHGAQVDNAELVAQIADIDSRQPNVRVLSYSSWEVVDWEGESGGGSGSSEAQEITCVRISGTSWTEQQDVVEELLVRVRA